MEMTKTFWQGGMLRFFTGFLAAMLIVSPSARGGDDDDSARPDHPAVRLHSSSCRTAWKVIGLGLAAPLAVYGIGQFGVSPLYEAQLADKGRQLLDFPIPEKPDLR